MHESAIDAVNGVIVAPPPPSEMAPRKRVSPITITLLASVLFAGAYATFQRVGTTANAETVEYTQNLAGGFLAIGMTEDQPGFVVLSALDRSRVSVETSQASNRLAGTHTIVEIKTPSHTLRTRLRGPRVLIVSEDGRVDGQAIDWSTEEFNALRLAADCGHETASGKHRCGRPFTDVHETLALWPRKRIPNPIRDFLAPYRDHRLRTPATTQP